MSCPTAVGAALIASGHPLVLASAPSFDAPIHTLDEVRDASFTSSMVIRYQDWLQVRHPAAGATCATQHYAGRVASWLVGCWALTGQLPTLDGCLAEVDEHGRTLRLVVPDLAPTTDAGPLDVVAALQQHMEPMLATACRVGHITWRLAWGGVATSLAGALLRSAESLDLRRRDQVMSDAGTMLAEEAWPVPRPLTSISNGRQHRRTCCVIHLSPHHRKCDSCPHHDREH